VSAATPSVGREIVEPLPAAQTADILGLLEYLEAHGGTSDLFQVTQETHGTFVEVITTGKGAEMLDIGDTPQRLVRLTPLGQRFVRADMEERKRIWRTQLLKLTLFRVVRDLIELRGGERGRGAVLREIQERLPREDAGRQFDTLVGWARFGQLF